MLSLVAEFSTAICCLASACHHQLPSAHLPRLLPPFAQKSIATSAPARQESDNSTFIDQKFASGEQTAAFDAQPASQLASKAGLCVPLSAGMQSCRPAEACPALLVLACRGPASRNI